MVEVSRIEFVAIIPKRITKSIPAEMPNGMPDSVHAKIVKIKSIVKMKNEKIKEKDVKQLFKIVLEFSLYAAKNSQISEVKLGKILGDIPPLELNELILDTALYDFLNKAITLNETKEMLINILQQHGAELLLMLLTDDTFFQESSC